MQFNSKIYHKKSFILFVFLFQFLSLSSQVTSTFNDQLYDTLNILPKNRNRAIIDNIGLNMVIWSFDHYIKGGSYSHINMKTISNNIVSGAVWDTDQFETNFFSHPYCGALYFNNARSNGIEFWNSIPYAVAGSLMWETFLENEPISKNDIVCTPFGGVFFGEIMFRVSDKFIDDRTKSWNRFGREFLVTLISPMRSLNRILNGDSWKVRNTSGRSFQSNTTAFNVSLGHKAIYKNEFNNYHFVNSTFLDIDLMYGNPFIDDFYKPYDYFKLNVSLNINKGNTYISTINGLGALWMEQCSLKEKNSYLHYGIFQHYDYYNSFDSKNGQKINLYEFSEIVAFGLGAEYQSENQRKIKLSAFLNGVVLGGYYTDHFTVMSRDYNMASGFCCKLNTDFLMQNNFNIQMKFENYQLFTWNGFDPNYSPLKDNAEINIQGDGGFANISLLNLNLNYTFWKNFNVSTHFSYFNIFNHYTYYKDKRREIFENKIGLKYIF